MMLLLQACLFLAIGASLARKESSATRKSDVGLFIVSYNSKEQPNDTLLKGSIDASVKNDDADFIHQAKDYKFKTVGIGQDLRPGVADEESPDHQRWWMFRLRTTIKEVMEEYQRRDEEDFIVLMADALDVFVTQSLDTNTLELVKHRFLTDFADRKIVFSSQIYCCNPWELRSVARREYDNFFASQKDQGSAPPSMYKHLNAGLFIGYASAILEMANEMQIWNKSYQNPESLIATRTIAQVHMRDLEVDDDEWQLAAWFFEDQSKTRPLAALDYHQELFTVTSTVRAKQRENGFLVMSQDHFEEMFGDFPEEPVEMDQITVCPYAFQPDSKSWVNLLTGMSPLVFHFAGNEWLCACKIFRAESYKNIPDKFRDNCEKNYDRWLGRVEQGIQDVAHTADPLEKVFLMDDPNKSVLVAPGGILKDADVRHFKLNEDTVHRMLTGDPYNDHGFLGTIFGALVGALSFAVSTIFFCF